MLLQSFIAEQGPLNDEAGLRAKEILEAKLPKEKPNDDGIARRSNH